MVFRKIAIPNRPEKDNLRPAMSPISRLMSEHYQKLAYLFGILCLIFAVVAQIITIKNVRQESKVFAIDGAGTIHVGLLEDLKSNSPLFENIALTATQVVFQRSPVGLDLLELQPHLFSELAIKKLNTDVTDQLEDLKARNLHQKPEISQIISLAEKKGVRYLQVKGTIVGAGSFQGVPITEAHEFKIFFALEANKNLSDKKRYPYIIADFTIKEMVQI